MDCTILDVHDDIAYSVTLTRFPQGYALPQTVHKKLDISDTVEISTHKPYLLLFIKSFVFGKPQKEYFWKQWRLIWNAAYDNAVFRFSLGSTLFEKVRKECYSFLKIFA